MSGRESLSALLGGEACPEQAGSLIGIEHEYSLTRDGAQVDFRELIHDLPVHGLRLDPGDVNAYRLRSGLALTAEGAEAELATPPVPVVRGFARELENWSNTARQQLERLLPPGVT